jgi:hypothetical protein
MGCGNTRMRPAAKTGRDLHGVDADANLIPAFNVL